jgi:hypothetical protein
MLRKDFKKNIFLYLTLKSFVTINFENENRNVITDFVL